MTSAHQQGEVLVSRLHPRPTLAGDLGCPVLFSENEQSPQFPDRAIVNIWKTKKATRALRRVAFSETVPQALQRFRLAADNVRTGLSVQTTNELPTAQTHLYPKPLACRFVRTDRLCENQRCLACPARRPCRQR